MGVAHASWKTNNAPPPAHTTTRSFPLGDRIATKPPRLEALRLWASPQLLVIVVGSLVYTENDRPNTRVMLSRTDFGVEQKYKYTSIVLYIHVRNPRQLELAVEEPRDMWLL